MPAGLDITFFKMSALCKGKFHAVRHPPTILPDPAQHFMQERVSQIWHAQGTHERPIRGMWQDPWPNNWHGGPIL